MKPTVEEIAFNSTLPICLDQTFPGANWTDRRRDTGEGRYTLELMSCKSSVSFSEIPKMTRWQNNGMCKV